MKKLFTIIISLLCVISFCGCNDKDALERGEKGAIVYKDKVYFQSQNEFFYPAQPSSDIVVGTIRNLYRTKLKVHVSEHDLEENILFVDFTWIWHKETFEYPDVFEVKINKMVDSKNNTFWEAEDQFLTLNDVIDKEGVAPPQGIKISNSVACFIEDYSYLRISIMGIYLCGEKAYIKVGNRNNTFYSVKDEYAQIFKV